MKPSDYQLLALLRSHGVDIDPTEYEAFVEELRARRMTEPGEGPQAGLEVLAIISIALSVGLTIAASFFKPKPQTPGSGGVRAREKVGDTKNTARTFAPRYGFDSIQEPATMGSTIPVVYADRFAYLNSPSYSASAAAFLSSYSWYVGTPQPPKGQVGGIRINTPLLFSRVRTIRGSQYLSAIFLLSEGSIYQLDCDCFAVGNTSLQGYRIPVGLILNDPLSSVASAVTRRFSVYFRRYGGRIIGDEDWIQGRTGEYDPANSENDGGQDVFAVRAINNQYERYSAFAQKPSASAVFGCYGFIPNNMAVRISPRVRPTITLRTEPSGSDGDFVVKIDDDPQALAEFWKSKYFWSGRSGVIAVYGDRGSIIYGESSGYGAGTTASGRFVIYYLSPKSDETTRIHFDQTNTDGEKEDVDANLKCGDVAGIVASRQRAADKSLIIGELYKIGGVIVILVGRSLTRPESAEDTARLYADDGEPFVSDQDESPGNGRGVYYTFMVVRAIGPDANYAEVSEEDIEQPDRTGKQVKPPEYKRSDNISDLDSDPIFSNATNQGQIFRLAVANVTTPRATRVLEVGIKSTLGITISGLCNFRDCETLKDINDKAGNKYDGDKFDKDEKINTQNFTSGTVSATEARWGFFRLWIANEGEPLEPCREHLFAIRGYPSQAVFNQIRFVFSFEARADIMFEPVPGAEARAMKTSATTVVWLDQAGPGGNYIFLRNISQQGPSNPVYIAFRGYTMPMSQLEGYMRLSSIEPKKDIGYGYAEGKSMFDTWAGAAEAFIYQEITTTAEQGPEHEITYVNCINTGRLPDHTYDKLSTIGLNIQASAEWTQFSQFSAYVTGGRVVERLVRRDAPGIYSSGSNYGPSNLFPEIFYDLLLNPTFGTGNLISSAQVIRTDFALAALWCMARGYFCDVAIVNKTNLRQWAADMAATHLLELTQKDGKFSLQPAVVFDQPVPISALFTTGNIVEGSFALEYLERDDREPIQVAVTYREERINPDDLYSRGFFSEERTVLVREASTPETATLETIDMSDYCTNMLHAIDAAAYIIRVRRLVTHSIRFRSTPDMIVATLSTGDYIRVAMDTTFYDEFANGVVLPDGTIVTTRPDLVGPGSFSATVWDGSQAAPSETTMLVDSEGKASPTGVVFVRKNTTSQVRTYKIESLALTEDMEIEIEAVEHPTNSSGFSRITRNWPSGRGYSDANWIIERG